MHQGRPFAVPGDGFKACSLKWKVAPQQRYIKAWKPAQVAWSNGVPVTQAVGYDCSAHDSKRYAASVGKQDKKYRNVYPLRDWGWDRERCETEIKAAGLPVPAKSACYFCPSTKPHELKDLPTHQLKAIVIMETRARPQLKSMKGLWRNGTKGVKTGVAKPGAMTDFIADAGLLPMDEVIRLMDDTPKDIDIDDTTLNNFLDIELSGHKA
jgi:hypothetical protein